MMMKDNFYSESVQILFYYRVFYFSFTQAHTRNIHTSPANFTLERVVQNFRARSQLRVLQLEDSDEMLHPVFSDDLADSTEPNPPGNVAENLDAGKENDDASQFCRSDDKRGTYKIKRAKLARPQFGQIDASELQKSQTDDEKISVLVNADQIEEADLGEITRRDLRLGVLNKHALSGPELWNSLAPELKNPGISLDTFESLLKTELFKRAYPVV